jgi:hypothetical protein
MAHVVFEEHSWANEIHVVFPQDPARREGKSDREHAPRPAHLRIDRSTGDVRPHGLVDELPAAVRRELAHVLGNFASVLDPEPQREPVLT